MADIGQDILADVDYVFGSLEDPVCVLVDVIPPTCTYPYRELACGENHIHNATCVYINQVSSSGQLDK